MNRKDVIDLHFITPIENTPSIMKYGIASHNLSKKLPHKSVAMQEIQEIRMDKKIPGTEKYIHDYANLYFDAHNPMLSKVRQYNDTICILRVDVRILDLPDIIIADRNASSDYVRFYPVAEGLAAINRDLLFARYWTHPENIIQEWAHKSLKCAEVLVPNKVDSKYIFGAYVANQTALVAFNSLNIELSAVVKNGIFF